MPTHAGSDTGIMMEDKVAPSTAPELHHKSTRWDPLDAATSTSNLLQGPVCRMDEAVCHTESTAAYDPTDDVRRTTPSKGNRADTPSRIQAPSEKSYP
jgi:hypothetical protein